MVSIRKSNESGSGRGREALRTGEASTSPPEPEKAVSARRAKAEGSSSRERPHSVPEIIGITDHDLSEDGSTIVLTMETKGHGPIQVKLPADYLDGLFSVLRDLKVRAQMVRNPEKTVLSFRKLRRWAVAAHPGYDSVLMVLDGDTPLETCYATSAPVAKELASALVATAEKVTHTNSRSDN